MSFNCIRSIISEPFLTCHFYIFGLDCVGLQSRDKLLKALRGMNAGEAADQVIRKVDKMLKNGDRALRDVRVSKVILSKLLFFIWF